jgi:hypothetical protein
MATTDVTTKSTTAETQVAPSNRDEQLDRLRDLEQLVDALLEAAQEVSSLACEIADEDEEQEEVFNAARSLIDEVDAIEIPVARKLRYLATAIKDEWAQPGDLFDEGNKGDDKNDGAAA